MNTPDWILKIKTPNIRTKKKIPIYAPYVLHNEKKYVMESVNDHWFSSKRHFWHRQIGYNLRLSNLQAAVGLGQIEHIEDTLQRKRGIALWYFRHLDKFKKILVPLTVTKNCTSNHWHIAYRLVNPRFDVMAVRTYLAKHHIETRGFFIPLHLQPVYRKKEYTGKYPNAELPAQTGILFPSGPTLSEENVAYICSLLNIYFRN